MLFNNSLVHRQLIHPVDIAIFQSVFQTDTKPPQDSHGWYVLNEEQYRFFWGIQKARDDEKDFVLSVIIEELQSLQLQGVSTIDIYSMVLALQGKIVAIENS